MTIIEVSQIYKIKTKTAISDAEKRSIQSMVLLGANQKDIRKHLMRSDLILEKIQQVSPTVKFFESYPNS